MIPERICLTRVDARPRPGPVSPSTCRSRSMDFVKGYVEV